MNVRPLHDRIIVQRLDEGEQKVGGIIIPTPPKKSRSRARSSPPATARSKDDGKRIPLDVKAGDRILFGKYCGPGDQARW